jgi:hypothetical protein
MFDEERTSGWRSLLADKKSEDFICVCRGLVPDIFQTGDPLLDHLLLQYKVLAVDFERFNLVFDRHHSPAPAGAGMVTCLFMGKHLSFHLLFCFP